MAIATADTRNPRPLPRVIRRGLGRLGLRLRMIGVMRGLGKGALILAALAAMAMAADVAFVLPSTARWAIWGTWMATAAVALAAGVIRPVIRRLAWTDLAALAERGEPSLSERLTTAVGLLRQQPHGSPELIAAVVDDATARTGQLDLARGVSMRAALAWFIVGGMAAGLVIAPAVIKPEPFLNLSKRFLLPWADIERVSRFVVELTPGDKVIAAGTDIAVSASVRSRFGEAIPRREALIEWTSTDVRPHRVPMLADAEAPPGQGRFTVNLPRLTGSISYRAVIGQDASRRHQITVVESPAVTRLQAYVEPPAYTRRPGAPAREPSRIDAWEDSRVTLEVEASRPLQHAEVTWPALTPEAKTPSAAAPSRVVSLKPGADATRWSAIVVAEASGPFVIRLRDEYDLENKPEAARRVVVRADAPPRLAIVAPDDFQETSATDYLTVAIAASDDVAVASAELHASIERSPGSTGPASASVVAPLDGLGTPMARGEATLSFATLALKPGDVISYRVRVSDNRPAPRGPNITWSAAHTLRIVEHSASLRSRQDTADREALRARLEAIQKAVAANRQKTEPLRSHAEAVRRGQVIWEETKANELADREATAHEVSDQLQLLSRDLAGHETFHPLARPARQIAEVENHAARASLEAARRASDPEKRQTELEQAGARLNAVTWKVDELKRKFDELARLDDDRRRLNELAQHEDELAARAEDAAQAGDRTRLDGLVDEQDRLRRELDEVLKNSPSLRAEALAAQAREASALAARARALAEQQREQARRTADDGPKSAAVKALAARQRALEDDARRFALQVDEPLAQNGRGRVDVGAMARAGDAIELGDLDQARDRALDAENALNRLNRDLEDVRDDPKALARRLARRQEALRNETAEAIRPAREHPPQTPEGKAALADRLKPLLSRQEAIARLAAAIAVPPEQKDKGREATEKTTRARDDLRDPRPKEVEGHQNESRDALNRLADALPDPNQRRDRARQKLGEARSRFEEIARDLEKHLRETAPNPGKPHDFARGAADLAARIMPLAQREREVAKLLSALDPEPRAVPQRDRAARRTLELADAIETLRQQAPAPAPLQTKPDEPRPVAAWRVVGAFSIDAPAPFAIDRPVDLGAKYPDLKRQPATWRPSAPVDAQGTIDLGQIFGRADRLAAFGYAEISSPAARPARLLIGSDDSLTVWLNGKTVYDFRGNRSHSPATDRVEVSLLSGINRFIVKCANMNGEWKYSVAVSQDSAGPGQNPAAGLTPQQSRFEQLRAALPAQQVAARSALERLQQKIDGRTPADDLAAALAGDERALKAAEPRTPPGDAPARAELAADQRRIANALSNLQVPDAPLAQAEAIRRATEAARALELAADQINPAQAREAVARANQAVSALARQLADEQSPRERIRELAAVQQKLAGERIGRDPADEAHQQHQIAEALARIPVESKHEAADAIAAAVELSDQAARLDAGPRTDEATLAAARQRAARALEKLAMAAADIPIVAGRNNAPAPHEARTPDDPDLGITPAVQTDSATLAQRQRHIREGLQAILGDSTPAQQAVRERSTALGRELADLRERSREISPRAQSPARAAADLLSRAAPETMDRATQSLHQGRPGEALWAQRQAADQAEQAARHVEDLAAALRADRPPGMSDSANDDLAAAQRAAHAAGQHLSRATAPAQASAEAAQAARAAAAAMHQAAQGLRAADRSARGSAKARRPSASTSDPRGPLSDQGGPDLAGLKAAVRAKTGRNWGELPGHLRTEILQMSQGRYREDYARLIELYFREIANDAADPGARP